MEPDPFLGIPPVRRARGFRLYAVTGQRFLDLYQDGGRAVLGRRPEGVSRELKALASRGLSGDVPSVYGARLAAALRRLLPGMRSCRIASSRETALRLASLYLGRTVGEGDLPDPAVAAPGAAREVSLWRPYLPPAFEPAAEVLLPVLPFGAAGAPSAVCFRGDPPDGFPPSETPSPLLLAACVRALYNLSDRPAPAWWEGAADPDLWERRGPYLAARCAEGEYGERRRAALARGVLLHPRWPGPSILPAEASEGEQAALRAALGASGRDVG